MNPAPGQASTRGHPETRSAIRRRIAAVAITLIAVAAILFLASGRLAWTWAWVYLGIGLATALVNGAVLLRTHPGTVAERGRLQLEKRWDRAVSGVYALAQFLAVPLVAGLDARFGWSGELGLALHVLGAFVLAAAYALPSWAMSANAYFSTAARIQSDRGHAVCDTGPYRLVRHPGYAGFILQSLGTPCLLGSRWALVPGVAAAVSMVVRTSFEDRMLQAELPGYAEYAREVRYRLVPGIW
jgi:protein-S-isoprenylcysteine O-methyltransferase Ste14